MNEASVKREMIQSMKDHNGYGRRIEDSYGVGIYDTILIPRGYPVFTAEVKIIRSGGAFGPTPRQLIELQRIDVVAANKGHVVPVMIGWRDGVYYFHPPKDVIQAADCFSLAVGLDFHDQLVQYYHVCEAKQWKANQL